MKTAHDQWPMKQNERLESTLRALKVAEIPRALAVPIVALSRTETGYVWSLQRPFAEPGKRGRNCLGLIVGIEDVWFHRTISKSPAGLQFLQKKGWIKQGEGGKLAKAGALANPLKPQAAMVFFEWIYVTKNFDLLNMFAVGPTQCNLGVYMTPLNQCATTMRSPEEAWDAYINGSQDYGHLVRRYMGYLIPKTSFSDGCCTVPLPVKGDRKKTVDWLLRQTYGGNDNPASRATTENMYDNWRGQWKPPYKDVYAEVDAVAATIWL